MMQNKCEANQENLVSKARQMQARDHTQYKLPIFQVDQYVLLFKSSLQNSKSKKFLHKWSGPFQIASIVNPLSPLALDRIAFPCCSKKSAQSPAKPLNSLQDLAHAVDERFVLAYPAEPPALVALAWEETLLGIVPS
ncbi:hypothetical protein DSO57_1028550 [Entomophthora muscae]|uniref:Uncharacterized protein n=1 Tax=Entomophthora muscae TaxID=34485 RepID=A0ACC2TCT9_9FUNG|nr:hypothetical protein DSO57_1028550 [Entomophthora muscae]